jgi:hypothetical protein
MTPPPSRRLRARRARRKTPCSCRLAKLLCTVAARELISADLLKDAAWAAVRAAGATQRSGSELETAEAEVEEAKAIAAALGDVLIGWRVGGRVIIVVADMPHVLKKVSERGVGE